MHDIPILMLHTINDKPELSPMGELSVSPAGLEQYMKLFQKWDYQMINMSDLVNKNYNANKNFIVLTFDDGYKDNLTLALPILKKYGARATIFVNPDYISLETDESSDWGFMTWDEVRAAEESGIFDIQAHTMTHEFIFESDEVVDYYTPDKFNNYYWLAWMLWPESPRKWDSTAMQYKTMIPTGYPIFKYTRRLSARKFTPSQEYIDFLIKQHNEGTAETFSGNKGTYETAEDYTKYTVWEICDCKKILEEKLNKEIHTICFPGGGYTDEALAIAEKAGYRCYMTASRMRIGNNNDHVKELHAGRFTALNRTSFSRIHPGVLPDEFWDKWVATLSLGNFQNMKKYKIMKKAMSLIWHR